MCVLVQPFEGRCEVIVLVLQLNQQLYNYSSCSSEPRQTYGQTVAWHLETSQIYGKYSRGQFTEEIIEIEIVVPLEVEAENILKDSMCVLFRRTLFSVRKCVESTDYEEGLYNRENIPQKLPKLRRTTERWFLTCASFYIERFSYWTAKKSKERSVLSEINVHKTRQDTNKHKNLCLISEEGGVTVWVMKSDNIQGQVVCNSKYSKV